jgi:hypothetical protein
MTFREFKHKINNNARPTGWTEGTFFMFELSKVKPNIAMTYRKTELDPSDKDINILIWNITQAVWDTN